MKLSRLISWFDLVPHDRRGSPNRVRATPLRWKYGPCRLGIVIGTVALFVTGPSLSAQQTGRVQGTVRAGESLQPLQGVQVTLDGTGLGGLSGADGRFVIADVPAGSYTVGVTLIGYGREEQQITVAAGVSVTVDFTLFVRAVELEALVVTGTATAARQREIGNSIAVISSQQIEAMNPGNIDDILRGNAPGVTVQGQTGTAGAGSQVLLRGLGSIEGRNRPLIYVDGIRLNDRGAYESGSTATGNTGQAATVLNSIDPADIDRVEIIKGAAAATLYGTEASAGVIQIFTKRGTTGAPRWSLSVETGIADPLQVGPDEDPTGLHLNDCTVGGPLRPDQTGPDPDCPESGSWLKSAFSQDYHLSVRGGTAGGFTYYGSGGFAIQEGIANVPDRPEGVTVGYDDNEAQDLNLRGNFGFQPASGLNVRLNSAYTRRDIGWIPDGDTDRGFYNNVVFLDEGATPDNQDGLVFQQDIDQAIDHFTISGNFDWTPSSSFTNRLNIGLDWSNSRTITLRPLGFFDFPEGSRVWDEEQTRVITVDYAGSWSQDITDSWRSTLSWGGQLNDREDRGLRVDCRGFIAPGEQVLSECQEAQFEGGGIGLQEDRRGFRSGGGFAEARFGWKDRFFLSGGVRADAFSQINQDLDLTFDFLLYPKVQATYTLSDEDFWPDWIETFRIRGAWGESGEPPPQNALQTLWQIAGADEIPESGFIIQSVGNPDIVAERTSEFELGFDASMFDDRVVLQATGFHSKTTDGILFNPLLPSSGIVEDIPVNPGEWTRKGVEASFDVVALDMDDFRLSVNGQYQWFDNEVQSLGELGTGDPVCLDTDFSQRICVGDAFPQAFGDEQAENPDEFALPVLMDTTLNLGRTIPNQEFSAGLTANFLGRLTFDVFGSGQFGHILIDDAAQELADEDIWPQCAGVDDAVDAFEDNGTPLPFTAAEILRCTDADNEHWFFSGDYFRIQSASLTYQLPENWLPGWFERASLQFQVTNLALFTGYPTGADPDAILGGAVNELFRSSGYTLPVPRTFTLRLRANF